MEGFQSFLLGQLIIRNRITGAQQASHLAPWRLTQYVSPLGVLPFLLISHLSGWYFEYLEFPNQRRTKIQENNNYESHFVSVRSVSLFFAISYLFIFPVYFADPV
jgi:hypothetical protein